MRDSAGEGPPGRLALILLPTSCPDLPFFAFPASRVGTPPPFTLTPPLLLHTRPGPPPEKEEKKEEREEQKDGALICAGYDAVAMTFFPSR